MVRSSGFKIPEELLKKKQGEKPLEEYDKDITMKELEQRRQQILNDMKITSEDILHQQHFGQAYFLTNNE